MLCHDIVYVIQRHGKGEDGECKLELQIYEGAKNCRVEIPASLKPEFYEFYAEMSVSKTKNLEKKIYDFYGEMSHIYPRNHAHIMIFYAIFFRRTCCSHHASAFSFGEVDFFPRYSMVYFHRADHKPHNRNSSGTTRFQVVLHPKPAPVAGRVES